MNTIFNKINDKIKPDKLSKYLYSNIFQNLLNKIYDCYSHELKTIIDQKDREKRLCQIIFTHCYNKTSTTKIAIKKTLQVLLTTSQYEKFGLKLIYAILDVGVEITDDPYSPECVSDILSQEFKVMNVDPKLEAIANKVMEKMNLSKDGKYGNIILIVMIIGIILSLIRVIQECNKSKILTLDMKSKTKFMQEQVKQICISRSFINKWRLKRIIKQKLNSEDYDAYGEKLKEAILDSGPELTEDETYTLVEAANV